MDLPAKEKLTAPILPDDLTESQQSSVSTAWFVPDLLLVPACLRIIAELEQRHGRLQLCPGDARRTDQVAGSEGTKSAVRGSTDVGAKE